MIDSDNVATTARNLFEAQAAELANYKQLATTAIDDAVALRAQLAALQCEDELPELPEAVAWMSPGKERLEFSRQDTVYGSHTIPLYARQAQAMIRAKMVPLTDDQIYELYSEPSSDAEMVAFARAIEAAHGITGKQND